MQLCCSTHQSVAICMTICQLKPNWFQLCCSKREHHIHSVRAFKGTCSSTACEFFIRVSSPCSTCDARFPESHVAETFVSPSGLSPKVASHTQRNETLRTFPWARPRPLGPMLSGLLRMERMCVLTLAHTFYGCSGREGHPCFNSFIDRSRIPELCPATIRRSLRLIRRPSTTLRQIINFTDGGFLLLCGDVPLGTGMAATNGTAYSELRWRRAELTRNKCDKDGHCNNNIRMSSEQSGTTLAAQQPRPMAQKSRVSCRTTHQCTASTTRHQHEQLPRASQTSIHLNTTHTQKPRTTAETSHSTHTLQPPEAPFAKLQARQAPRKQTHVKKRHDAPNHPVMVVPSLNRHTPVASAFSHGLTAEKTLKMNWVVKRERVVVQRHGHVSPTFVR